MCYMSSRDWWDLGDGALMAVVGSQALFFDLHPTCARLFLSPPSCLLHHRFDPSTLAQVVASLAVPQRNSSIGLHSFAVCLRHGRHCERLPQYPMDSSDISLLLTNDILCIFTRQSSVLF